VHKVIKIATCTAAAVLFSTGIGATASTANAATPHGTATCNGCKYNYISGNAVRIRQAPGGKILGLTWYNQRVRLLGKQTGQWVNVSTSGPKGRTLTGWVSSNYIGTQY
jgi:hypothetical protein